MVKHGLRLLSGSGYGLYPPDEQGKPSPLAGTACAASLLIVAHIGDTVRARRAIDAVFWGDGDDYVGFQELTGRPAAYIEGLEAGFEGWDQYRSSGDDFHKGHSDGLALRDLIQ
jgi:hypothetical protein